MFLPLGGVIASFSGRGLYCHTFPSIHDPPIILLLHSGSTSNLYFLFSPLPPVIRSVSFLPWLPSALLAWRSATAASLVQPTAPHWIPVRHIPLLFFLSARLLNPVPLSRLADRACTPELRPGLPSFPQVLQRGAAHSCSAFSLPSSLSVLTWIAIGLFRTQPPISVHPVMCFSNTATGWLVASFHIGG